MPIFMSKAMADINIGNPGDIRSIFKLTAMFPIVNLKLQCTCTPKNPSIRILISMKYILGVMTEAYIIICWPQCLYLAQQWLHFLTMSLEENKIHVVFHLQQYNMCECVVIVMAIKNTLCLTSHGVKNTTYESG